MNEFDTSHTSISGDRAMVGRDEERRRLRSILERGCGAAVISGEPGIGKTTLLRWALDQARSDGALVLECSPAEPEQELGFAALADLLSPLADEAFDELPGVQRAALLAALRRGDDPRESDGLAVSAGLVSLISVLAASAPVVIAVDDVQWLDAASARAIAYAARRTERVSALYLGALRTAFGAASAPDPWPTPDTTVISLGGLGVEEIAGLVGGGLPTLRAARELWDRTGGNPLFAQEAVAAPDGATSTALETLLRTRIEALPAATGEALAILALVGEPERSRVAILLGSDAEKLLRPAMKNGLVEWREEHLRFRHPLIAEAAIPRDDPLELRRLHAELAERDPDPERRAWHLARSTDPPAPEVAEQIAVAAEAAAARGAGVSAAQLLREAARLLPRGSERRTDVLVRGSELANMGADWPLAAELAAEALRDSPRGPSRARALMLDWSLNRSGRPPGAAYFEARGDVRVQARILPDLAAGEYTFGRGRRRGLILARAGVDRARRSGDPALLSYALESLADLQVEAGLPEALETLREGIGLDMVSGDEYWSPLARDAIRLIYRDDLEPARVTLEALAASAWERGHDDSGLAISANLSNLECRAGRLDLAERYAETYARHTRDVFVDSLACYRLGLIAAYRGDVARATRLAREGLDLADRAGNRHWGPSFLRAVIGTAACCAEDHAGALAAVGGMADELDDEGVGNPGVYLFAGDDLEALIATGDIETARLRAKRLQSLGEATDQRRALGIAARARGMLAAEVGNTREAEEELDEAMTLHAELPDPLERGRTLLARGSAMRRAKRWGDARREIEAAIGEFEEMGAPGWVERGRRELGRVGGRRPASTDELTETEQRVASLAAQGLTNAEIAGALFVSVGTVEKSLTRVYRKLGVRSRTQLARTLASTETPPD